jgi:type VI secretion system ImpA/VasJ family protein
MTENTDPRGLIPLLKGRDAGFGDLSVDVETRLGFIDDELMKRGTLAAATLDVPAVRNHSIEILRHASHLAAFRGLAVSLTHEGTPEGLESALLLNTAMFESLWPDLHPSGQINARRRDAWAKDIISALEAGTDRVLQQNGDLSEACREALWRLIPAVKGAGLETSRLTKLATRAPIETGPAVSDTSISGGAEIIRLDARGRAELRRDIRALADRINRFDPAAPIGYAMRGYAAWLEFAALPEASSGGTTTIQSMPSVIAEEHRKAVDRPSPPALVRLEDRLSLSPDWFEGQKLAAEMASRLGLAAVSAAIRERCLQRVAALPGLRALKYANGKPFLPDDVIRWLDSPSETASESSGDAPSLIAELESLNHRLAAAVSPRARACVKLDLAASLRHAGLEAQAQMMATEIRDQMLADKTHDWDSELFARTSVYVKDGG